MTLEEAIEFLKYAMENPNPNGNLTDEHTQIVLQVIALAIKALEDIEEWDKLRLICANECIFVYKVKED